MCNCKERKETKEVRDGNELKQNLENLVKRLNPIKEENLQKEFVETCHSEKNVD